MRSLFEAIRLSRIQLFCVVSVILFAACSGLADNYYVATTGNNTTGNGTIGNPWRTITKGQSVLNPGDTLLVRGGRYYEYTQISRSGTEGNPVTIKNYAEEEVIVDGTDAVTGWTQCASDEAFLTVQGVVNPNYANIYKATIHEDGLSSDQSKYMLYENGIHSRIARWPDAVLGYGEEVENYEVLEPEAYGQTDYILDTSALTQADDYWNGAWVDILLYNYNNNIVHRITISDFYSHRLYVDPVLPRTISAGGTKRDAYSILNHPHILDSPGEFAHTMTPDGNGYYTFYFWPIDTANLASLIRIPSRAIGIYSYDKDYVTVEGFKVVQTSVHGIYLRGISVSNRATGLTIKDCIVEDTGDTGIRIRRANATLVEGCSVLRAGGKGIYIVSSIDATIQDSSAQDTGETNITFHDVSHGKLIRNSTYGSAGAHGNGMSIYECEQILLAYNSYYNSRPVFQGLKNMIMYANTSNHRTNVWPDTSTGDHTEGYLLYLNNVYLDVNNNVAASLDFKGSTGKEPYPSVYAVNNILRGTTWSVEGVVDLSYNL